MSRIIYKNSSKKGLHQASPIIRPALWKPNNTNEKHILNKLCDGVYVISDFSDSNKDNYHLGLMDFKMRNLGIAYHLVNLRPLNIDKGKLYTQYKTKYRSFWNKFGIGSSKDLIKTFAHKEIISHAKKHNYKRICILSDRILFHQHFNQELTEKAKIIRNNHVVYLGGIQKNWKHFEDFNDLESYSLNKKNKTFGTYALCLSRTLINTIHQEYFSSGLRNTNNSQPPKKALDYLIYDLVVNQEGTRKKKGVAHFKGRVIYPNLIVPFLYNKTEEYSNNRNFNKELYKDLEIEEYEKVVKDIEDSIKKNNLSLRQTFWDTNLWLSHSEIKNKIKFWKPQWDDEWLHWIKHKYKNKDKLYHKNSLIHFVEGINQAFVVLVPSYNNEKIYQKNLESIFSQKYIHFRIIYINDCSTDHTANLVKNWLNKRNYWGRSIYLDQMVNQKQGSGRFLGFHLSDDDEIICLVDGDDWLYGDKVFNILSQEYLTHNLMCSYGSYYQYRKEKINKTLLKGARQFPERILRDRTFRDYQWTSQHLRTARAKLFKQIKLLDIMDHEGKFLQMCTDVAEMMPVLEMAGLHQKNIMKPLYVYNRGNSVRYKSSFYRLKEEGNEKNQKYHNKIKKYINNITPYPAMALKNLFPWNGISRKINIVWEKEKKNIDPILLNYPPFIIKINHYENSSAEKLESWTPTFFIKDLSQFTFFFNFLKFFDMTDSDYLGCSSGNPLPPSYIYLTHKGFDNDQHVIATKIHAVHKNHKWLLDINKDHVWPGIYRPKILKQLMKGKTTAIKLICLTIKPDSFERNNKKLFENPITTLEDSHEDYEEDDTMEISIDSDLDSLDK